MKTHTAIFCDFDGTVATHDVGYSLFHHFSGGKNEALIPAWKSLQMSSRECLLAEAAFVSATTQEIMSFLDPFEIDPGFLSFERLCRDHNVPLTIVSDGLDIYISAILGRYGLSHLPVMSNKGHLIDNGIQITFPWDNKDCARCGCCKGERMTEYRTAIQTPVRLAFVGDGYSDLCATRQADLLLAKKDLARYCDQQQIAYNPFRDFFEVADILINKGYLNKPARAGSRE